MRNMELIMLLFLQWSSGNSKPELEVIHRPLLTTVNCWGIFFPACHLGLRFLYLYLCNPDYQLMPPSSPFHPLSPELIIGCHHKLTILSIWGNLLLQMAEDDGVRGKAQLMHCNHLGI